MREAVKSWGAANNIKQGQVVFPHVRIDERLRAEVGYIVREGIKPQASPGCPLMYSYATNAKILEDEHMVQMLINCVCQRLVLLHNVDSRDAISNVRIGLCDPIRIFIKQEPHSAKKATTETWRLIHSVSVVDQIIERLLFGRYQKWCIANYMRIPQKPGFGDNLIDWEHLAQVKSLFKDPKDSDATSWDLTFDAVDHDILAEIRCYATRYNEYFERVTRNYMEVHKQSIFTLSDGTWIVQEVQALMNSGRFCTGSGNSDVRSFTSWIVAMMTTKQLIQIQQNFVMGDDCVEDNEASVKELEAFYANIGKIMTFHDAREGFEFCSHRVEGGQIEYLNLAKTVYRFVHNPDMEHWDQLKRIVRIDAQRELVNRLAEQFGLPADC